ncbi:hypothetical protein GOBAR_AA30001 [Gossypium barbadense]|uniref:DUF4283 domain-containing protein n=1 Tax=Gossypium barbadense TaxID=3634 RepID=A0A2P5WHW9_GOSBA|nr:hypothetical protein GOBAR_AA30001 [Gossypium barbadense]
MATLRNNMEVDLAGLTLDEEEDAVLQVQVGVNTDREEGGFQLVGCFLTASIIHFPVMRSTIANLWHLVRRVQIRDLWEKRAQSRRALMMTSVWLRDEGEGRWGGNSGVRQNLGNNSWGLVKILGNWNNLDPVLGINLEGRASNPWKKRGNLSRTQGHTLMEHDLEDEVLIGEDGKKRNRIEIEDALARDETNTLAVRNRKVEEISAIGNRGHGLTG